MSGSMVRLSRAKISFILLVCLAGFVYAAPNVLSESTRSSLPNWWPSETINLGLDLRGGSHLLLQVETDVVLQEQFEGISDLIRRNLRNSELRFTEVRVGGRAPYTLSLQFDSTQDQESARTLLQEELGQDVVVTAEPGNTLSVSLSETFIVERRDYAMQQSLEIIRRRVDETGTKEPLIQRQGANRILLQLPGVEDPERLKDLLGRTAQLTFHLVDLERTNQSQSSRERQRLPVTRLKVPAVDGAGRFGPGSSYVLHRRAMITGDMLTDARPSFQEGRPVVSFRLDARGTERFGRVTTENVGRPFAIVLDGKVISAPNIQTAITGGQAIITGRFTTQEVQDLSLLLRAGALPAPLKILEERTVGPGLGADSIESGKIASMVGLAAVIVFSIIVYGLFGVMAVLALLMNLILIFAALSALQATLTLPGIAGIVLTIGMAVDANVLIFERIREETRKGRTPVSAIDSGYSNAYSSIVDANITTLIAAILLYIFGTGPVRGFAVTLSIGIVTSFFSALMLTRLFMTTWLWRTKPDKIKA